MGSVWLSSSTRWLWRGTKRAWMVALQAQVSHSCSSTVRQQIPSSCAVQSLLRLTCSAMHQIAMYDLASAMVLQALPVSAALCLRSMSRKDPSFLVGSFNEVFFCRLVCSMPSWQLEETRSHHMPVAACV